MSAAAVPIGYRPAPPQAQPDPAPEPCRADLDALPVPAGPLAVEWCPDLNRAEDLDYVHALAEFVACHIPGGSPADARVTGDGKARVLVTTTRLDPDGNPGPKIRRAVTLPEGINLP